MMDAQESRVLWDMVDGPMPRGLLGVGSGDVFHDGERWTLLLGGYSSTFRNRLYVATAPSASDPFTTTWTVQQDRRRRAAALIADSPRSAWDGGGMHTPSYLPPSGDVPARIYYAGRAGRRHVGAGSGYAIGMLELRNDRWIRRESPILTGSVHRSSVLEPKVIRHDDRYIMWFLATPHEVAPGEQPDYELRTTTSLNGVDDWTPPTAFATVQEGVFNIALTESGNEWQMVLARGTNLHGTSPFPPQGLWLMRANQPSEQRTAWSEPVRLLDTDTPSTPAWMGRGVCDPAVVVAPDGTLTVFVSGTRRYRSWKSLVFQQLKRRKRIPVPAPFYLCTAALRFSPFTGRTFLRDEG
jgi:hypothetical protein